MKELAEKTKLFVSKSILLKAHKGNPQKPSAVAAIQHDAHGGIESQTTESTDNTAYSSESDLGLEADGPSRLAYMIFEAEMAGAEHTTLNREHEDDADKRVTLEAENGRLQAEREGSPCVALSESKDMLVAAQTLGKEVQRQLSALGQGKGERKSRKSRPGRGGNGEKGG